VITKINPTLKEHISDNLDVNEVQRTRRDPYRPIKSALKNESEKPFRAGILCANNAVLNRLGPCTTRIFERTHEMKP
jgi:hypothetical protein